MSVWIVLQHGRVPTRRLEKLRPIKEKFEKKKGSYRINIYSPEFGKTHTRKFHDYLDFIPVGKVTNEATGEYRWLKMRNGKIEVVVRKKIP